MLTTRYKKVLRDIISDLPKTTVLIIAITVGLFGVGTILGSYAVLSREMAKNYMGIVPAAATIDIENDSLSEDIVKQAKSVDGITDAERRSTVVGRMRVGEQWYRMLLFVIDDFDAMKMNKVYKEIGQWPPLEGTMLVERSALQVMQAEIGDAITFQTADGNKSEIQIAGTVYDAGVAPAWQEKSGYGYITVETLRKLGINTGFNELKLRVAQSLSENTEEIQKKALDVVKVLETKGYKVHQIQVPPPKKHPHQGLMNTALFIFMAFAIMLIILASILVSTSISTLMTKQVREIGVMKTIGATSFQVAGLYFIMISFISLLAIVISLYFSPQTAGALIHKMGGLLNLNIYDASIPSWVYIGQVICGFAIPLGVTAFPVIRGSRVTIREALGSYGVSKKNFGQGKFEKLLSRLMVFSQTFTLSIRNVFRQPSKLVLSVLLLSVAGAVFMTAMNLSESWKITLEKMNVHNLFDVEVRTDKTFDGKQAIAEIRKMEGIKNVEAWISAPASFNLSNGKYHISNAYPDRGHGNAMIYGLPVPSQMVKFPVIEGRWLNNSGTKEIVLPLVHLKKYKLGEQIKIAIDGKPSEWTIVGFYEEVGFNALGYVSVNALNAFLDGSSTNMIRASLIDRNIESTTQINGIEKVLEQLGAPTIMAGSTGLRIEIIEKHLVIIVKALIAMAFIMALVGAIGLMSMISMNVLERTRELGVMRAIGATPAKILWLIMAEGLVIAVVSLLTANILSLFISLGLGPSIGMMSFKSPLALSISYSGVVIWALIVTTGALAATLYPAWRAIKITTREALAY